MNGDETPDRTSDRMPDRTPGRPPDRTPDRTSDRTPDRTPELTSDRTPEGIPERTSGRAIRVALVDDQPLMRMAMATLVSAEADLQLVGEAGDGREGLALVRRTRPDVVLCDIRMPVLDGLGLLAEVSADPALRAVRVVVLTTFELDEYVFEALQHGASGFLLKDADPGYLLDAIRVVAEGGSLLAPSVTRRVIQAFGTPGRRPGRPHPQVAALTDREREVVAWVSTGRSNREIADELRLSADTVRTHVSRAMGKLGARDRAQLVVFAFQSGLGR